MTAIALCIMTQVMETFCTSEQMTFLYDNDTDNWIYAAKNLRRQNLPTLNYTVCVVWEWDIYYYNGKSWEGMTGFNIRVEIHMDESILFGFSGNSNDAIVINYCIC